MFADAVRDVAALARPGAVLVTRRPDRARVRDEYERVRELLSPLSVPVHVLCGNHDDRERLRAAFPLLDDDVAGEDYRYAARCGPLRIVAVDTTTRAVSRGRLGPRAPGLARRAARRGARDPDHRGHAPSAAAARHPVWDAIGLSDADRAALGEVVAGRGHVRRIVAGHVHRAAVGSVGGCPVFTCPATWLQGRLDFAHPNELSVVAEPPGFAVHVTVGGELTSHVQPVGAW